VAERRVAVLTAGDHARAERGAVVLVLDERLGAVRADMVAGERRLG
jgi:hypothetical protein